MIYDLEYTTDGEHQANLLPQAMISRLSYCLSALDARAEDTEKLLRLSIYTSDRAWNPDQSWVSIYLENIGRSKILVLVNKSHPVRRNRLIKPPVRDGVQAFLLRFRSHVEDEVVAKGGWNGLTFKAYLTTDPESQ